MTATIIDGRKVAERLRQELAQKVANHVAQGKRAPRIDVIRIGKDPASEVYVRMKEKAAQALGMQGVQHHLPATATADEVRSLIDDLRADEQVDAMLLQLPIPEHLDEAELIQRIGAGKDADGFHVENLGRLIRGEETVVPCTPEAVMILIREAGVPIEGKHAVVVGRSNIVGKPVAQLLLQANATVTVAHSRTRDLPALCRQADILVAAVGRPEMVRGDWIREGAIVIDVGVNRLDGGALVGDVAFAEAVQRAGWITPVPGGVGPMTITCLLANTLALYERG